MYPEFIHYGHDKFDKDLFVPIRNVGFVKPVGGLWASPINSNYGWKDWCLSEEFHISLLDRSFRFSLNKAAKVYTIDNRKQLYSLPIDHNKSYKIDLSIRPFLDFELISKRYDAIWLTIDGERDTRCLRPLNLYGWDVESLLVLNPNIIITNYGKTKN